MKSLLGKTILGLKVSEDASTLHFDTDKGHVTYLTDGDCCSETWFADITGVSALLGGTVVDVEEVENMTAYNVNDGRGRQEEDQAYGWKIKTNKGYADIVYRNSINGYYGGSLVGVVINEAKIATLKPIIDDWSS